MITVFSPGISSDARSSGECTHPFGTDWPRSDGLIDNLSGEQEVCPLNVTPIAITAFFVCHSQSRRRRTVLPFGPQHSQLPSQPEEDLQAAHSSLVFCDTLVEIDLPNSATMPVPTYQMPADSPNKFMQAILMDNTVVF